MFALFASLTLSRDASKPMLDLAKAREELLTKSLEDIERATAETWAARAAACLDLAHEAETRQGRQVRLTEAENYRQEALEHAAMTEDIPFLQSIIAEIDAHKTAKEQRPTLPTTAKSPRGARPVRGLRLKPIADAGNARPGRGATSPASR